MEELIKVPDLGGDGGEVVEINVAPGDVIAADDTILTVESDKATMEIPAPRAGKVVAVLVNVGDTINSGMDILRIESDATPAHRRPASRRVRRGAVEETVPIPDAPLEPEVPAASQAVEIRVPDIGGDKAPVVEVSVAVGDEIVLMIRW